jgi:dienelactone hydrolase
LARLYYYALFAVVALAAVGGWFLMTPNEEMPYVSEDVNFPASDGIQISATWYVPKDSEPPFKAVILIHEFESNRHDWDSFIPDFVERGYAILAYDIRGFGSSQSVPRDDEYYDNLIRDVEGAVTYLQGRRDVDSSRIGVVGAQLGGTVAYAASAYIEGVKVSVAISPSPTIGTTLRGEGVENFHPKSIMFQFLDTERVNIQPLIDKAGEPNLVKIYRPESPAVRASGMALLHRDLRAFGDLLRFLDENL